MAYNNASVQDEYRIVSEEITMDRNGKKPDIIYCDACECWHSPGSIYCSGGNTEDTE